VVAILGCDDAQHRQVIIDLPVEVRVNNEWEEGLAATLRSAVRTAKARQAALLVLQCDQYRIMPDDLRTLYEHWRWAPGIACVSRWGSYAGPPAILPVHYYDDVLRLRGDVGARSVLYDRHRPSPDEIRNPRAAFDLDSPEELRIAKQWTACQLGDAL
jgi:molybdenum cofactor cytidylyltransferase